MAVIAQRSYKTAFEVSQIEETLTRITGPMHIDAMRSAIPGKHEYEIVAGMYETVQKHNVGFSYPVICSVHGEILHNQSHHNRLEEGQLLLIDAGAESPRFYATDITRTTPTGGVFSSKQADIYNIVLSAQLEAIDNMKPGISYMDIHLKAAGRIAKGLKEIGIMKGDMDEAVANGAHALFFPHGLGHLLGLDVHDMEDLGEDFVGYDSGILRSKQFGTAYLRFARILKPGFVLTVEPGIYFNPALIQLWKEQKKFARFINYNVLETYREFGGIRIEDNVLIMENGSRVLGSPIPKTIKEIENLF